jgi:hypothetical protein
MGWNLAESYPYDIILLDLMLPILDGINFCKQLRGNNATILNPNRDTPVLLMTALDEVNNRIIGLDAGADDYVIKPFVIEELLARIRDIRSSEKLFYKKVLDIYALSVDYDPKAETSEKFFQTVQNKMHWAAHGHTAAEIVVIRADPNKDNAGMTTWANASKGGLPNKRDAIIAKNYLSDEELETLNRIVTAYLEFAELQARSRKTMTMADWISKLDDFLKLSDREILTGGGRISAKLAKEKGEAAYDGWKQKQLSEPSAVEVHFNEAIGKTKSLEAVKLKPKGNKND